MPSAVLRCSFGPPNHNHSAIDVCMSYRMHTSSNLPCEAVGRGQRMNRLPPMRLVERMCGRNRYTHLFSGWASLEKCCDLSSAADVDKLLTPGLFIATHPPHISIHFPFCSPRHHATKTFISAWLRLISFLFAAHSKTRSRVKASYVLPIDNAASAASMEELRPEYEEHIDLFVLIILIYLVIEWSHLHMYHH